MSPRTLALTAAVLASLAPQLVHKVHACDAAGCSAQAQTCSAAQPQAQPPQPQSQASQPQSEQQAAAGMRVAIDPATGQYTSAPALPSQAEAAMTAPAAVPVEEPLPGGGFKIDTRGVRHAFVATANPGGLPQTRCIDVREAPEN